MRLINADALIERLKPYIDKFGTDAFPYSLVHAAFIYEIEQEPTVNAKLIRKSEWIKEQNCFYRCRMCGAHYPLIKGCMDYKYCPNCGAVMIPIIWQEPFLPMDIEREKTEE